MAFGLWERATAVKNTGWMYGWMDRWMVIDGRDRLDRSDR